MPGSGENALDSSKRKSPNSRIGTKSKLCFNWPVFAMIAAHKFTIVKMLKNKGGQKLLRINRLSSPPVQIIPGQLHPYV